MTIDPPIMPSYRRKNKKCMVKKLNKRQVEYLMWCFKDGVRTSKDLSGGQREHLEAIKIYEDMDTHIDRQLEHFSQAGY